MDELIEGARRPRSIGWSILGWTSCALAIIAGLSVLLMVVGQVYTHADAVDMPAGHPHYRVTEGQAFFSCASLVGYAAGDRDPLCQGSEHFSVAFLVPSFLLLIGFAALAGWARRRGRAAKGLDPRARPRWRHVAVRIAWGLAAAIGVLVLLLSTVAFVVGPNGGTWATTGAIPPPVPGLAEWKARVQPLVGELNEEAQSLADTFERGGVVAQTDCDALRATVTQLESASLPAPDPELDDLVRGAIDKTKAAATACSKAAQSPDSYESLGFGWRWSLAAMDWSKVADRVLELKLGPA